WEILPQAAAPGEVILSKRNELGLLSNFASTPFTFHGQRYASLEGFWQMMKYPEGTDDERATFVGMTWTNTRAEVAQMTAFAAKHAGDVAERNMKTMGITWVTFEGRRMEYRFTGQGGFYDLIVAALKPDHHQEADAPAAWHYFDILTEIRTELQHGGKL
ncbi:MAG: hypothetical protein RL616_893, partial [Verrucomicrobiota bacterium]